MSDDPRFPRIPEGMQRALDRAPDFAELMRQEEERATKWKETEKTLDNHWRRQHNPVLDIFDDVLSLVETFQNDLDGEHEVGIYIVGSVSVVHIRSIEHRTPSLLVFHGVDGEGRTTLAVQHIAQLNLQLVAVPKIADEPYRIGFVHSAD